MDKQTLIILLAKIADVIEENKQYLTELDAIIGDADHGVNMARGFCAIRENLSGYGSLSCGEILFDAGKVMIRITAGSSGAFYGSCFKVMGKEIGEKEAISYRDFVNAFEKGIEKIQFLGMAKEGEKTMVDSMLPALRALKSTDNAKEGFEKALADAQIALEHTKEIIATKGRASYVKERSLGHQDPGATSFCMMLQTANDFIK